jgi:hypothetical protein
MTALLPILAKSSEDSMIKLIFGAIVLIFWVGGAIVSAINKRVQESKRSARYGQTPATFMRPVPPPVPNPAGFTGKAKPAKRAAKRKAVAAVPLPPARPALTTTMSQSAPAAQPARPAAAQAAPSAIAHLLRRPETLRAALILNEVLSPPLSLRNGVQSGRRVE